MIFSYIFILTFLVAVICKLSSWVSFLATHWYNYTALESLVLKSKVLPYIFEFKLIFLIVYCSYPTPLLSDLLKPSSICQYSLNYLKLVEFAESFFDCNFLRLLVCLHINLYNFLQKKCQHVFTMDDDDGKKFETSEGPRNTPGAYV